MVLNTIHIAVETLPAATNVEIVVPACGAYEKTSLMIRVWRFPGVIPVAVISLNVCIFLPFAILDPYLIVISIRAWFIASKTGNLITSVRQHGLNDRFFISLEAEIMVHSGAREF